MVDFVAKILLVDLVCVVAETKLVVTLANVLVICLAVGMYLNKTRRNDIRTFYIRINQVHGDFTFKFCLSRMSRLPEKDDVNIRGLRYGALQSIKQAFRDAFELEKEVLDDEEKLISFLRATLTILERRPYPTIDAQLYRNNSEMCQNIHQLEARICKHVFATQSVNLVSYCLDSKLMELWQAVLFWCENPSVPAKFLVSLLARHNCYAGDVSSTDIIFRGFWNVLNNADDRRDLRSILKTLDLPFHDLADHGIFL